MEKEERNTNFDPFLPKENNNNLLLEEGRT